MSDLKLLQPQEIDVFYLLPAIRREIAFELKKGGCGQKEIAKRLHLTEAAVSQYINAKRASDIDLGTTIKTHIHAVAPTLLDEKTVMREIQHIIRMAHEERIICRIHEKLSAIQTNCTICFDHETPHS